MFRGSTMKYAACDDELTQQDKTISYPKGDKGK